ncbi:hypothetical protein NXS19_005477 [Fusarium pseudograminearum]|nr:hypothetical protein NXS19_005477 [Fusarium pseudograminearum]
MADIMIPNVRSPLSEASNRINSNHPPQEAHRYKPRHDRPPASTVNNPHARAMGIRLHTFLAGLLLRNRSRLAQNHKEILH